MQHDSIKVLIVGAGAIGASVAGWLAPHHKELYIMDTGDVQSALKKTGITLYRSDTPSIRETLHVKTIDAISELPDADIIILSVKNYDLPTLAETIKKTAGDRPIIVSFANGVENQSILPPLFSKVIYAVISYNARRDKPVVIAYQKKGPIIIGTPDNSLQNELHTVQSIMNAGCETIITDRLADAVHSKIVMNLTNALDTLTGQGFSAVSNFSIYQKLLTDTLSEGVDIIKAAGYRECRLGGMPSFFLIKLGSVMPGIIARPIFRHKLKSMVMSSMTQDILLRHAGISEIDSLTGYIVRLAENHRMKAPYNKTIYRLAKERFNQNFTPMSCEEIAAEIEKTKLSGI